MLNSVSGSCQGTFLPSCNGAGSWKYVGRTWWRTGRYMRLLCKKYGVSIVVAIHQPRQEVGDRQSCDSANCKKHALNPRETERDRTPQNGLKSSFKNHSPRASKVAVLFDHLLLLTSPGDVVYNGKMTEAQPGEARQHPLKRCQKRRISKCRGGGKGGGQRGQSSVLRLPPSNGATSASR